MIHVTLTPHPDDPKKKPRVSHHDITLRKFLFLLASNGFLFTLEEVVKIEVDSI